MAGLELQQRQLQKQLQVLSQKQIQTLELLSLSSDDLREKIFKEAEENPALQISDISEIRSANSPRRNPSFKTSAHLGTSSSQGALDSDNFQKALESKADTRETLRQHLLSQLNMMRIEETERSLAERLIYNLDDKGFHILSPLSIAKSSEKKVSGGLLQKCMELVRSLDPPGMCTANIQECLYVQAKLRQADELTLFILDGHLEFINPPLASKATKKINDFIAKQKSLFAQHMEAEKIFSRQAQEEEVQKSIDFIRSLDPNPSSEYGTQDTVYISPDLSIEELDSVENVIEDFEKGIVKGKEKNFIVKLSNSFLPEVSISQDFSQFASQDGNPKNRELLAKAKTLLDAINYRKNTMLSAACTLVKKQEQFFLHGPGHLVAFTQRELGKILEVHESTVSRLANEKFFRTSWGLYEMKYFFSNPVGDSSRDQVEFEIRRILEQHKADKKALSDQKISDLLKEQGINVARRTVNKYRENLNIKSSYERKL